MKELPDIKQLDAEAKDALIVALWEEVQKLRIQLVKKPKKTAKNSSLPSAKGFKAQVNSKDKTSKGFVKLSDHLTTAARLQNAA
jgi:transposase